MGASDFVAARTNTYDDVPAGQTDFRLKHFSIAHDRAEILLLRQAAPEPAKATEPAVGGDRRRVEPAGVNQARRLAGVAALQGRPRAHDAYARYFVRFIQEYRRAGVPIDAITLQNEPREPQSERLSGGMDLRDDEEARLVVAVGRALKHARRRRRILGYDHNWSLHPNDVGAADDPANPEYAASLLANPSRPPLPRRHGVPLLSRAIPER